VLDSLAYVARSGDSHIAGLVLVDNSVGETPAPNAAPPPKSPVRGPKRSATCTREECTSDLSAMMTAAADNCAPRGMRAISTAC